MRPHPCLDGPEGAQIARMLTEDWRVPADIEASLRAATERNSLPPVAEVIVSGSEAHRAAYLFETGGGTWVLSPRCRAGELVAIRESGVRPVPITGALSHVAEDWALRERLAVPTVLLINLTPDTFHHTPTVALGVGLVAAALRQRERARVTIMDMKLGVTAEDILAYCLRERPQMVGASIDFGEEALFRRLFGALRSSDGGYHPLLFAGNYLAHLNAQALTREIAGLVVCMGEGEDFACDLAQLAMGRRGPEEVRGAAWRDEDGRFRLNAAAATSMGDLPFPALDTLPAVAVGGGSVCLEISRGCTYGACSFCPRTHKVRRWKAVPVERVVEMVGAVASALEVFPTARRRILFVDEEFIGTEGGGDATMRQEALALGLARLRSGLSFEFNTSVRNVYCSGRDREWHVRRWRALAAWRDAGLVRILLGVESGSNSVLERFGKGHRAEDSIKAMRVLSWLGIDVRATFIAFDPAMSGDEFRSNLEFLGRTDACIRRAEPVDDEALGRLYDLLDTPAWVASRVTGMPVYAKVCYLLNEMKVLPDTSFASRLKGEPGYRDPRMGRIAHAGARWMDDANSLSWMIGTGPAATSTENARLREKVVRDIHHLSFELFAHLNDWSDDDDFGLVAFSGRLAELGQAYLDGLPDRLDDRWATRRRHIAHLVGRLTGSQEHSGSCAG